MDSSFFCLLGRRDRWVFKPTRVHDWGHCMRNHSVATNVTNNFGSFTLKTGRKLNSP